MKEAYTAIIPELQEQLASQQVQLHFNPPNSPHFGGSWEREIRSLKQALMTTIGAQSVTFEVLYTLLVEIEWILNSKPLGYTSSNISESRSHYTKLPSHGVARFIASSCDIPTVYTCDISTQMVT